MKKKLSYKEIIKKSHNITEYPTAKGIKMIMEQVDVQKSEDDEWIDADEYFKNKS